MEKKFCFSDHIEIVNDMYDYLVYSPVYSNKHGLYLVNDDYKKPIKEILLINYKLVIYYVDGGIEILENEVLNVKVCDNFFKRRMNMTIAGNLFKYGKEDALIHGLDITKAIDYNCKNSIRKRSL